MPDNKCKFKVGDIIIGNAHANEKYFYTTLGWTGKVVEIFEDGDFKAATYKNGVCRQEECVLKDKYFDLFQAAGDYIAPLF